MDLLMILLRGHFRHNAVIATFYPAAMADVGNVASGGGKM